MRAHVYKKIMCKDIKAGKYKARLVVDGKRVLAIESATALTREREAQALHCLAATGSRLALPLNFGQATPQIKGIIL
jgi:GxxExxY protein